MPDQDRPCPRCGSPVPDAEDCPICTPLAETVPYVDPATTGTVDAPPGYEILGVLGEGGMGVVYLARQTGLKRLVALKMIRGGGRDRFRTEAEAAGRLAHPNVVQVFEVGEHAGEPFLAMEFCPGGSLAGRLKAGPLPVREAAELVRAVARGVAAAHAAGIVHRDLKPGNILLAAASTTEHSEQPKVADFGLAKALDEENDRTRTGAVLGTPAYMAPEQAAGETKRVGPACDVWALGVLLYECLTGATPFRGGTVAATLDRVRRDEPTPPRRLRREVPPDLETVCLKCLEKDPARRYPSAEAVADDLGRVLDFEPIRARPVGPVERAWRGVRRRPAVVLGAALAVVLVGAALGAWRLWALGEARLQEAGAQTVEYYRALTRRHGAPVGLGPMTEAEAAAPPLGYRFHKVGPRVVRVDRLTFHTDPHNPTAPATWFGLDAAPTLLAEEHSFRFTYDEAGRVLTEEGRDAWGLVLWSLAYPDPETAVLADRRTGPVQRAEHSASYRLRLTWDAAGFLARAVGVDDQGRPTRGKAGFAGVELEPTPAGQVARLAFLDRDDAGGLAPSRDPKRPAATFGYDAESRARRVAYFAPDGRPTDGPEGVHAAERSYEPDGRSTRYFDRDGKPTTPSGKSAHRAVLRFLGPAAVEETGFDPDGKAVPVEPPAVYRLLARLHPVGFVEEIRCLGDDGRPARRDMTALAEGISRLTFEYDESGGKVSTTFWIDRGGEFLPRVRLNAQNLPAREWFYDAAGRPTGRRPGPTSRRPSTTTPAGRPGTPTSTGKGTPPRTRTSGRTVRRSCTPPGATSASWRTSARAARR